MALIRNLSEHNHLRTTSVHANQPADDRLVIVQDVVEGRVVTAGARYVDGRWVGEENGTDFTDTISERAIWFETYLFEPNSASTEDQIEMGVSPVRVAGSMTISLSPHLN